MELHMIHECAVQDSQSHVLESKIMLIL